MASIFDLVYVAIYVRVSTLGQQTDGTSLATQVAALQALAEREGYTVLKKHIFSDTVSGVSTLRSGFEAMIAVIEAKEVSAVLILDPDRLGRGALEIASLCQRINEAGAYVQFLTGPSAGSPESELFLMLSGWAAGQERLKIAERTMRGKRATARSGRLPIGVGGPGMYGYDYDPFTHTRSINEAEAAVLRMAYEWCDGGWSPYRIGCALNDLGIRTKRGCLWHYRTVVSLFRHTSYKGWDVYGKYRCRIVYVKKGTRDEKRTVERTLRPENEWIWIEGFSPVIVDADVWERVQRRLDMPRSRRQAAPYLLTGFTRCSLCGSNINGASRYAGRRRYRCRGTAATMTSPKICSAGYMDADDLEQQVIDGLARALGVPSVVLSEIDGFLSTGDGDLAERIAELRKKVRDCSTKESRFLLLYGDGVTDEESVRSQLVPLQQLRRECERVLGELEEQRHLAQDAERIKELVLQRCQELSEGIDALDFDGKKAMLGVLDVQVEAEPGKVRMTMTLAENSTTIGRTSV